MSATAALKAETGSFPQRPTTRRRIPLAELASRGSAAASPALNRVMPAAASSGGVPVAAFQSFSR
ncbi:FxSxx-COOH protein [Streptomyces sp. NBC_01537]|uniref:FxSxx-COOH cyclophane-containing RiPP peptide n=1 Tax=Streptomyces sp. NBC_01537 TaxID=2903896 RepID=UPI0038680E2D